MMLIRSIIVCLISIIFSWHFYKCHWINIYKYTALFKIFFSQPSFTAKHSLHFKTRQTPKNSKLISVGEINDWMRSDRKLIAGPYLSIVSGWNPKLQETLFFSKKYTSNKSWTFPHGWNPPLRSPNPFLTYKPYHQNVVTLWK